MFNGFTFDKNNNMYITENKRSEAYILKITPRKKVTIIATGKNFVGLCFDKNENLIVASKSCLYSINKDFL